MGAWGRACVVRSCVIHASHEMGRRSPLHHRSNRIDRSNRHATGKGPPIEFTAFPASFGPCPCEDFGPLGDCRRRDGLLAGRAQVGPAVRDSAG